MITLGIISPCYNEEAVLEHSVLRIEALRAELIAKGKISADSFMLIVNDGSKDRSWEIITRLHAQHQWLKGVDLVANAGHQSAIMAGMMIAKDKCDAAITIDVDLQDDLQAIEQMIDCHTAGYEVVYGVKKCRKADSWLKRHSAMSFYKIQKAMGVTAVYNHADFRLMSRKAMELLSHYPERNLYLRGLIASLGLSATTVDDVLSPRYAGTSKYTVSKMLRLGIDGITSFSIRPIRLVFLMGGLCLLLSIGMVAYVLISYCQGHVISGWSSIMISIWFIGSLLLLSIGIVGEYVGKIYTEVKQRPLYVVHQVLWNEDTP